PGQADSPKFMQETGTVGRWGAGSRIGWKHHGSNANGGITDGEWPQGVSPSGSRRVGERPSRGATDRGPVSAGARPGGRERGRELAQWPCRCGAEGVSFVATVRSARRAQPPYRRRPTDRVKSTDVWVS